MGVVAAITPWNLPQTLSSFKLAPALASGCTVVLKPSPETVLDTVVFAESVIEAGLPAGVVNIVPGGREIGAYLVAHPRVDKVSFTGSTPAGRLIGEACGRLLRPVTLELGGKSAAIVLDDPDLDLTTMTQELFISTMLNNGQTCFLASRVLAPRSRYEETVGFFTEFARSMRVGNSLDPTTQVGPLASARQRERVAGYIAKGINDGGRITVGGGQPADLDKGWFIEPTVFADVDNNTTIAQEEIFGPVLTIIPYTDDDDAVRIANESDYGLAGMVFGTDEDRGLDIARRIHTGTFGVNTYMPDAAAPFGGVKASGLGRELGPEAIGNYQNVKSIYLR
jgi:acyl-CoA reductase-like NAD-dependent aldehyde dehydrogenase